MRGYKASINGKCHNQIYELGKTYKIEFESENDEIQLCNVGFHFCEDPNNVFKYYNSNNSNLVLFEVEALGKIKHDNDKSVTDEIKIIREIPKQEYNSIFSVYEFKHDSNGNLIWKKGSYNNITEYKYDENNNCIFEKHSDGYTCKYKYDSNNNLIWLKYPIGTILECKYDSNNNKIQEKIQNGNITEYKYDTNDNLIWSKDLYGFVWEYKYDENSNLIWSKDSNGNIWEYPSYKVITY